MRCVYRSTRPQGSQPGWRHRPQAGARSLAPDSPRAMLNCNTCCSIQPTLELPPLLILATQPLRCCPHQLTCTSSAMQHCKDQPGEAAHSAWRGQCHAAAGLSHSRPSGMLHRAAPIVNSRDCQGGLPAQGKGSHRKRPHGIRTDSWGWGTYARRPQSSTQLMANWPTIHSAT